MSFTIDAPVFAAPRKSHVVRVVSAAIDPWTAGGTPAWVDTFLDRMNAVGELQVGWDGAMGMVVSDRAIVRAMNLITEVMERETPAPAVVPVSDGGLQLEWHYPTLQIEVYIDADGVATAWLQEGSRETDLDYYPSAHVARTLKALRPARS